jgi:hypothetical protein
MKRLASAFVVATLLQLAATATADIFPFMPADTYDATPDGIPTAADRNGRNPTNDGVPDIFDAVNRVAGTAYTDNEQIDSRFVQPDYVWEELNGQIALIGLTAGNTNTVGYYTDLGSGAARTALLSNFTGFGWKGSGTQADPYPGATFSLGTNNLFGWYLNSSGALYYSESGLNPSGWDHLMTFEVPELAGQTLWVKIGSANPVQWTFSDPYLLTWEDLNLGDTDYDDMIYLVDRVAPVPLPGAVLLGMLGLGYAGTMLRRHV